ncbi:MAG: ABC transporter ATP-binding protein [Syntrophobacteraceae bacterium]|jgi:putative ABC transport system ATP-binding protein|nr:ABC transporter ATP-binding protein [Syntrophobacteraceae bacterium]
MVVIEEVYKSYRRGAQEVPVLRGISLNIEQGSFVALMGPSGSGKTTLLNLIAGIDRPDSGRLTIASTDITQLDDTEMARWRANHIGFIFQFYNLMPVLTALENVELPLLLHRLNRRERREHALLALELVGLTDRLHHYPRELSGGQQQRVAIARALVTDPLLIMADEPTGDLDKQSATDVLDLIEELNRGSGKTVIMVTHDPRAAERALTIHHLDKGVLNNPGT